MKIKIAFFLFVAFLLHAGSVDGQRKSSAPKSKVLTARQIAEKVMPSVVLIITQDENGNPISQGSGFVYKPGLVVSNLHVFERATKAIVKNVKTGEVSKAVEVVGMNAKQDICIIRIDNRNFPSVALGDSHNVKTGDEVYVASNPKGLEGSFTKGIVSGVREKNRVEKNEHPLDTLARESVDQTTFQIDAAISPGSSGGVLLNVNGDAIGLVKSSVIGGQNLNFAIPIEQLIAVNLRFNHSIQLAGAVAYSDRDKEGVHGPVLSLTEKWYPRKDGKIFRNLQPIPTSKKVYDPTGNLVEDITYQATDGKFGLSFKYEYDENNIFTSQIYTLNNGKVEKTDFELQRGINYKLIVRKFSSSLGEIGKSGGMMVFDQKGNRVKWFFDDIIIESEYDSRGRAISEKQLRNGSAEIVSEFTYRDDNRGNWIVKYQRKRYPDSREVDPRKWFDGDPEFREIEYYER